MSLYKVLLHRLFSTHNEMGADTLEGLAKTLPKVGSYFILLKADVSSLKLEMKKEEYFITSKIVTTQVLTTKGVEVHTFNTEDSAYVLHVDTERVKLGGA